MCGLTEWNNKPISLELDHINGINNDNRLENLRIICPNCHAQTPTYRGRKNVIKQKTSKVRPKLQINVCIDCHKHISAGAVRCKSCSGKLRPRKVSRPTKEILELEIRNSSFSALGRKYKVSDNAVRKWATGYNIKW